jgi:hypothetical protein
MEPENVVNIPLYSSTLAYRSYRLKSISGSKFSMISPK